MIDNMVIILLQGIRKTGYLLSPQSESVLKEGLKYFEGLKSGYLIISGGYKKGSVTESSIAKKYIDSSSFPIGRNIFFEEKSAFAKGGTISNFQEIASLLESNYLDKRHYQFIVFTQVKTVSRTKIIAKKFLPSDQCSFIGIKTIYGNNVQTRYSTKLLFTIWNSVMYIATIAWSVFHK